MRIGRSEAEWGTEVTDGASAPHSGRRQVNGRGSGRASAAVDGYFGRGVEAAFLKDRRYVARSASSWPLSVGSLRPCFVA